VRPQAGDAEQIHVLEFAVTPDGPQGEEGSVAVIINEFKSGVFRF
jgi:hypothetical protein